MNRSNDFIFFGTGGLLTSICLRHLIEATIRPVLVVIQETKNTPYPNITAILCESHQIPYVLVPSVNTEGSIELLAKQKAAFGIVASFGEIFKKELLQLFPVYNVHTGVLPQYRGAFPNFWKILKNDDVYGVTVTKMEEKIDSGAIVLIQEEDFSSDIFSGEFFRKNYELAGRTLVKALELLRDSSFCLQPVDQQQSRYYRKFTANDMVLDPQDHVGHLYKKINRLQFYGNPVIENLHLTAAELLLEQEMDITGFEIIPASPTTSILKNKTGILLLKHRSV